MELYIYSLSCPSLFFSCFFVFLIFSIVMLYLIKTFNIDFRIVDNSAIMPILYIIGSTYSILLGLMCFQASMHAQDSQKIVQQESETVMKFSYDIKLLAKQSNVTVLHDTLIKYINNIIVLEWSAMAKAKHDNNNDILLDKMSMILLNYKPADANQQTIVNNAYYDLIELSKLRQRRFQISIDDIIPMYEWIGLIGVILSTLIVSMNLVLRFKLQIILLLLIIMVFSTTITFIITIDAPFRGITSTEPSQYMIKMSTSQLYPMCKI